MTNNNADQVIRCIKECWWRIAFLLAIPSCALVLAFTSWPFREQPWAALAAIATFLAVIVALYVPRRDEKTRGMERSQEKELLANLLIKEVLELSKEFKELLELESFAYTHIIRMNGLRAWLLTIRGGSDPNSLDYLLRLKVIFFRAEKEIFHNYKSGLNPGVVPKTSSLTSECQNSLVTLIQDLECALK